MSNRRRAGATLLSLSLALQAAYSAPPVDAAGGQTENVPAILRIRVIEGEGAVHTAGARSSQPIVIFLSDETGRAVEGASISVRLPNEGPTGTFPSGMNTEILLTGPDGRASIHGIQWARAAGPVQIRIAASKGEARAGLLSTQYLTDPSGSRPRRGSDSPNTSSRPPAATNPVSRSKWIVVAALIGGAAAGGVAMAARGGRPGTGSSPTAPPAATQPAAVIGTPTITVGRP